MKRLLVANWKMNPQSLSEAKELFLEVKKVASRMRNVQTVIAPPFLFLTELKKLYTGHRILFSAQDVSSEEYGSYTGEISSGMLKHSGVSFVIIGHSERRARGETDKLINKKVMRTVGKGLTAILCIGESNRDNNSGDYLSFLTRQIESSLQGVSAKQLSRVIVAYEPLWAIGKSEMYAMKPHELHETVLFIKKILVGLYDKKVGLGLKVLYGGSVEAGNILGLLKDGAIDGLLVGHSSLIPKEFSSLLHTADKA